MISGEIVERSDNSELNYVALFAAQQRRLAELFPQITSGDGIEREGGAVVVTLQSAVDEHEMTRWLLAATDGGVAILEAVPPTGQEPEVTFVELTGGDLDDVNAAMRIVSHVETQTGMAQEWNFNTGAADTADGTSGRPSP